MELVTLILAAAVAFGKTRAANSAIENDRVPLAIVEARQKMIDGKRLSAIKVLNAAIKNGKNPATRRELRSERTHLAQIFLTNDGEKKYELAESSRNSQGTNYLLLYRQAMELEPDNTRVMSGYALGLLTANDCSEALTILSQIKQLDPRMVELPYLKFRAQLCADPNALTTKEITALDRSAISPLYRKTSRAQEEYLRGNMKTALRFAREAIKTDNKFPQSYYWAFKVLEKEGRGIGYAQRYLYLCRGVTTEIRRHYTYEPQLCAQTNEVEQDLKNVEAKKRETN